MTHPGSRGDADSNSATGPAGDRHSREVAEQNGDDTIDLATRHDNDDSGNGNGDFHSNVLSNHGRQVAETLDAAFADWQDEVSARVYGSLATILRQVQDAHGNALKALRESNGDDRELWNAIVAYRRATHQAVLVPLRDYLHDNSPVLRVGETYLELLRVGLGIADELPETVLLREDSSLFAPANDDTTTIRLRKAALRVASTLRRGEPREREIRIRDIVGWHVGARMPLLYAQQFADLRDHFSRLEADIERALTVWTRGVLVAERDIDGPDVHSQDIVDWSQFRTIESARPENGSSPGARNGEPVSDAMPDSSRDDDGNSDADDPVEATRQQIWELAERLHQDLGDFAGVDVTVADPAPDAVAMADRRLQRDFNEARIGIARQPPESTLEAYGPAEKVRERQSVWGRWHRQVVSRLELSHQMLTVRRRLLETEDTILGTVARKTLNPIIDTTRAIEAELRRFESDAENACAAAEGGGDLEELHRELRRIRLRAGRFFTRTLRMMPGLVAADEALAEPGQGIWTAFLRSLDRLPETLEVHPLPPPDEQHVSPLGSVQRVELREYIRKSLGPMTRRLQPGAVPLRTQLRAAWMRIEEVQNVVLFNLDAAISEVESIKELPEGAEAEAEEDADDRDLSANVRAARRSRELANMGLARAGELLKDIIRGLEQPWETFSSATVDEVQSQWVSVLRRLRTGDDADQQWEGTWKGMLRRATAFRRSFSSDLADSYETVSGTLSRLVQRAKRLVRLGQSAVGGIQTTDRDLADAIDEVAAAPEIRRSLPLVYRHLFSFDPLSEPTLHEGRQPDVEWIANQFEHWRTTRRGGAIVVSAPQGAGRTSFLNVIAGGAISALESAVITSVGFKRRVESEAELVAVLAQALGHEEESDGTLQTLEVLIRDSDADDVRVCLIDDMEHVVIRTPEGTRLIERALVFFSRTDTEVFWVAATNDLTWRYVASSTSGTASGFLSHRKLQPFSTATLRDVVMSRHRRSGMQLRFEGSQAQAVAMRQWLHRKRTEDERQAFLQDLFFDRLARASGQNVMLALFYWIRACKFDTEKGLVTINPLAPLSLDAITRQPLAWAFSLEHFLLHKTLSTGEHARIARLDVEESVLLLEALLNRRLIEPAAVEGEEAQRNQLARVEIDSRYRIHPLLLNAVRTALEQRHIVY